MELDPEWIDNCTEVNLRKPLAVDIDQSRANVGSRLLCSCNLGAAPDRVVEASARLLSETPCTNVYSNQFFFRSRGLKLNLKATNYLTVINYDHVFS